MTKKNSLPLRAMCRSEYPVPADECAATEVETRVDELERHDVGVRAVLSMVAVDDSLVERFTQSSGCQAEQEKHGKRGHLVSGVSVAGEDNCEEFLTSFIPSDRDHVSLLHVSMEGTGYLN